MQTFLSKYRNSYLSYVLMINFYYCSSALYAGLISVYLLDKGYSATQVSIVVSAAYVVCMLIQPVIGKCHERFNQRIVNTILLVLGAVGCACFALCRNYLAMAVCYSFLMSMHNSPNPVLERLIVRSSYPYGWLRIWGSIGYSTGVQFAGLIYRYIAPAALYLFAAAAMLLCIIGMWGTVEVVPPEEKNASKEVKAAKSKGSYGAVLRNPVFLCYLLIAALFYGVTNVGYTFSSAYFNHSGIPIDTVSTIMLIAGLCEMPFIFYAHKFMNRLSNKVLLMMVFCMVIAQNFLYGIDAWMPLRILITFLTKHPAGMTFIMINMKIVDTIVDSDHQVAALTLVYMVRNFASILCQIISGRLLDTMGYAQTYAVLAGVMVVGVGLICLVRIPRGENKALFH